MGVHFSEVYQSVHYYSEVSSAFSHFASFCYCVFLLFSHDFKELLEGEFIIDRGFDLSEFESLFVIFKMIKYPFHCKSLFMAFAKFVGER